MDWFIARNGKPHGPLTFEALVDAANRGQLGRDDYVWQPGAQTWQRADDVAALWAPPLEPLPPARRRTSKRAIWLQGVVVALIVSGSALVVSFTILGSVDREQPRPMKRDCPLGDHLQGRCR
jgi:uncharacterized protein DUF4339